MKLTPIVISTAVLVLTTYGGGGGTPPQLIMQQSQTISGMVAIGAILLGVTVNVTCSVGSSTTTTRAGGSYSAPITGASLPCVVTTTSSDGKTMLHSLVAGLGSIGSTATANIAPLTELLLAQLVEQDLTEYMTGLGSMTTVNASDATAVQTVLVKVLQNVGFDTSGIGNFLGDTLSAGSSQSRDGVLDTLRSKLAGAGVTPTNLSTAVADTNGNSSGSVGLTVGTVLAPVSPACPTLKSGNHRLIKLSDGLTQVVTIDAAKLTVAVGGSGH